VAVARGMDGSNIGFEFIKYLWRLLLVITLRARTSAC